MGTVKTVAVSAYGPVAPHPTAAATLPDGYALTGGGANVHWTGHGSLLWQLEPAMTTKQVVTGGAKDHMVGAPADIDVYAVGIRL
ncbi:hypothetical protein [Micromonospora wenchangensis]|uniref:hypothetical protein n=1 Tax=Micromonospora wenchangensis TaxID=1185415 RepID=UPI0038072F20